MTRTQRAGLMRIIRDENKRRAANAAKVRAALTNSTWPASERALLTAFLKTQQPITTETKS